MKRDAFIVHDTTSEWLAMERRAEARQAQTERDLAAQRRQFKAADRLAKASARQSRGSLWTTRWNDRREQMRPWGQDDYCSAAAVLLLAVASGAGWVFGPP